MSSSLGPANMSVAEMTSLNSASVDVSLAGVCQRMASSSAKVLNHKSPAKIAAAPGSKTPAATPVARGGALPDEVDEAAE